MNIHEIKKNFRTPKAVDYPELQGYSPDAIYEGKMGPGGLYLAAQITFREKGVPYLTHFVLYAGKIRAAKPAKENAK
jgi:hypothetical protein